MLAFALFWSLAAAFMAVRAVVVLADPDADHRFLPALVAALFALNATVWVFRYQKRRRGTAADR
jgi:hypothetical protein